MEYKIITTELEKKLFVDAWEDSFGRKFDSQDFSWIFNNRNIMYVIFDENKVVAGYCLLNNTMIYNGNIVDGALCNNVFVRPDYQGLNLFVKLGQYALQKAGEHGVNIVIGIPNKNAIPGHKRVGWTSFDEIYFLEKHNVRSSAISFNNDVKVLNNENYDRYRDRLEEFSISISSQRSFSVLKDNYYFKWRYLDRPSANYKIFIFVENNKVLGYIVYKFHKPLKRLHIIDIEAANEMVFNALINISDTFEEPFNLINVWNSSIYSKCFFKAGFNLSTESNNLIAYAPQMQVPVILGNKVNIVLGDNEVF